MVFFILAAIFINAGTPRILPLGSIDPTLDQVADTNQSGVDWAFGNMTSQNHTIQSVQGLGCNIFYNGSSASQTVRGLCFCKC